MSTNIDGQEAWDELARHDNVKRGNAIASRPPANQQMPVDVALVMINSTLAEMATNGRDQQAAVWKEIQSLKAMIVELQTAVSNASPSDGWERTPDGLPICPRHGVAMRKRTGQGDVWYSHGVKTTADKLSYCKGMPGNDSPGWELGTARAGYVDGAAVVVPSTPSKMPTPPVPAGHGAQTIGEFCNATDAKYQMFGGGTGSLSFFDTVFGEGTFRAMSARGYAVAFQAYVSYVQENNVGKKLTVHNEAKARMLEAYRGEMGNG